MKRKFAVLLALPLVCLMLRADTVVEEIIARINDQIVTRSDLGREKQQLDQDMKQQGVSESDPKYADAQKNILRDLIDKQLLIDKAKEIGLTGDTEVIKRLDEMRKQMNLESMDDLAAEAQKQGVSFEDFKQNLRNSIVTQQVISREVGSRMQITEQEAQQFYDEHKKELEQPESVRLSEILVSTAGEPAPGADKNAAPAEDPAKVPVAEAKAGQLLAQINGGAKFEDVAKKSSDGPTAQDGGDLGSFRRGQLAKELEDLTFAMKPNEVSKVIRTRQGFVILKVLEHRSAGVPPLKEVEPQVQEAIYLKKLQPALRKYLTQLREDAYIDIKPGFIDTGASPNQTKPTFTTGDSTTVAKNQGKRKKKKLGIF